MSLEENKAIVRRWFEATNTQNLSIYDDLVAPDFVDHTRQVRGLENVKHFVSMVFKTFPDFHANIEDIIAEGEKVWFLEKDTGTDSSGKKMDATSLTILRIVNGKAVEGWGGYLHKTP